MNSVGRALFIGKTGSAGADRNEGFFLICGDLGHGQVGGRIAATNNHIDTLLIKPFPCFAGRDIGFVLMVGRDEFDFFAIDHAAHVSNRHLDGFGTSGAIDVGVDARHVGDKTDFDRVIGNLCRCGGAVAYPHSRYEGQTQQFT